MSKKKSLSDGQIEEACLLARMLGDSFRFRAMMLISRRGPISVSDICRELGARQPTASYHLGLLKLAKLVSTRRSGKQIMYRLSESLLGGDGWAALFLLHAAAKAAGQES